MVPIQRNQSRMSREAIEIIHKQRRFTVGQSDGHKREVAWSLDALLDVMSRQEWNDLQDLTRPQGSPDT